MPEDCFARLGLERRLRLAPEVLQEHYDRQCRAVHPDSGGKPTDFQQLQRAVEVLRSPGQRLRHWLEQGGAEFEAGGELEEEVTRHFGELSALLRTAAEVAKRQEEAQSALARSLAQREAMLLQSELERARVRTEKMMEGLCDRFEGFERDGAAVAWESAGRTARSLLFLEKWVRQLREAWAALLG